MTFESPFHQNGSFLQPVTVVTGLQPVTVVTGLQPVTVVTGAVCRSCSLFHKDCANNAKIKHNTRYFFTLFRKSNGHWNIPQYNNYSIFLSMTCVKKQT